MLEKEGGQGRRKRGKQKRNPTTRGKKQDLDWDLVEAGALAPLGDNGQLPLLGDAAHEEEDVDVPANER